MWTRTMSYAIKKKKEKKNREEVKYVAKKM